MYLAFPSSEYYDLADFLNTTPTFLTFPLSFVGSSSLKHV